MLEGIPDPIPPWWTKLDICGVLVEMYESLTPEQWSRVVASPEYKAVINRMCGLT